MGLSGCKMENISLNQGGIFKEVSSNFFSFYFLILKIILCCSEKRTIHLVQYFRVKNGGCRKTIH